VPRWRTFTRTGWYTSQVKDVPLRNDAGVRRNSFTRLRVERDGFACGLLAMIHSNLVFT